MTTAAPKPDDKKLDLARVTDTEHFLVYTKAVPYPRLSASVSEVRFLIRLLQAICSIASLVGMWIATYKSSFTSATQGASGLNAACFTSISSTFVALSCMFMYAFPATLGVPPHRHWCFSRVEVCIDLVWTIMWFATSIRLAVYGRCPQEAIIQIANGQFIVVDESMSSCFAWPFSTAAGFCAGALMFLILCMGIADLQRQARLVSAESHTHIMFARGNWRTT
ncbi:hypothetical protein HK105_201350 [Polyrhizophydium stewartii]|uniref:MARVEL domain-containing protein n=1 Tax=Polyrhizophydium stewartii TaxID=2732419 RepID=A0ABR4NHZ2_9FUNG